jgi:amino acid transporter
MSNSPPDPSHELRRNELGTSGIVFLVLAAAAPMTAVVVTVPLAIALGNGVGAPGAFALAGIVLLLFAVGFVAMSRHVTNVGAFYAYITRGLGRRFGVPSALIAVISYNAMMIAVVGIFGVFANQSFQSEFGINLPWEAWGAIGVVLVAILSFFEIELSAKVLGVALVCEVLILAVMDVGILLTNGPSAFPIHSFSPSAIFAGAAGVSIMYAFTSFVGFEATAIYGEEARNPRRTVPRATYIAVGIIAIFYGITCWALIAAFGSAHVVKAAGSDPAGFVFAANAKYIGGFTVDAMNLLIVSSSFAALLAFHNAAARYIFGLSRDGILPRQLARTHPRSGAPIAASALQISIAVVVVAAFAIAGLDPLLDLAAAFLGLGTLGIIILQAMASFSVVAFFRGHAGRSIWRTVIAPLLGGAGLTTGAFLVIKNYSQVTGAQSAVINHLWWVIPAVAIAGVLLAAYMQRKRPAVYAALGADQGDLAEVGWDVSHHDGAPVEPTPALYEAVAQNGERPELSPELAS